MLINRLNAELNPICHLLALLGGATIVVVSRLRVKISLHQSPDHSVPSAKAICKQGEIYTQGKNFSLRRCGDGGILLGGCINFEAGSGYCISPLSVFGGPPLSAETCSFNCRIYHLG